MLPRRYSSSLVVSSMKDLHWQLYSHAATLVLCQLGLFVRHGIKYQWMKHEVRFPFSFHWRLYSQDNILVLMAKWPGSHCLLCRQASHGPKPRSQARPSSVLQQDIRAGAKFRRAFGFPSSIFQTGGGGGMGTKSQSRAPITQRECRGLSVE